MKNLCKIFVFVIFLNSNLRGTSLPDYLQKYSDDQNIVSIFQDFDFENDPILDEFLDAGTILRAPDPQSIIDILVGLNALCILQQQFFLKTNKLNTRSLLDLPVFQSKITYDNKWSIRFYAFWNKINRSKFTAKSTNLCSYLALCSPSLINALENGASNIRDLFQDTEFNIDINKIFCLFKCMTVEQRRTGIMFKADKSNDWVQCRFLFPIYYIERNFFLTENQREAVENEFGALDQKSQEAFQKKHFISDKVGLGDTRIELNFLMQRPASTQLSFGVFVTLPTAFPFAKGLMGSSYPTPCDYPAPFDFTALINLRDKLQNASTPEAKDLIEKEAFDILSSTFLCALDRISANLLDRTLGNGGHFGIGGSLHTNTPLKLILKKYDWAEHFYWTARISVEYLFPAHEKRFFSHCVNPQEYVLRTFEQNEKDAEDNLLFLGKEFIRRLNLVAIDTSIQPGILFQYNGKWCYEGERFNAYIGSDIWMQGQEKFRDIFMNQPAKKEFHLCKAKAPLAFQWSTTAGLAYHLQRPSLNWVISLDASTTTLSRGIGEDYSICLQFHATF